MDIRELEDFKLSDAVKFHDELNPNLWENNKLKPEVKQQLLKIANDFILELGIAIPKIEDITVSGSNAAYSYTPHSDLDLHILVDFNQLSNDDVYQELFTSKKSLYNDSHDITVNGVPVELYVQDSNQPVVSLGEYSIVDDDWIKIPKKQKANFDQNATSAKFKKLGNMIELALKSNSLEKVEKVLDVIKRYRKAGLLSTGEFGPENLSFKALRSLGYIQKLYDYKNQLHSKELSLENIYGEDTVNEILDKDSAAKKIYWSQENVELDFYNNKKYTVHTAATQDKNKNILKYNFYNFPHYDLTGIEFSRAVGPWGDNFSVDNAGDQYTVFATLLETIKQYLRDEQPKYILFGAKEPNRAKLYQAFVNRFANKFGYKQISANTIPKPVTSVMLSSDDTPFLLQKIGTESVKESVKFIEGTNCKNCVWWKKDSEKPVGKDELNKYGGLKPPNKEYIAMSKRVDLVTLPGKDTVKEKGFCYHKDINDWVTERMCCAKWDGKGVIRDYKGESPLMESKAEAVRKIQKFLNKKYNANLDVDGILGPLTLQSINKFMPKAKKSSAPEPDKTTSVQGKEVKEASGYIPNEKEKNDPRFKTALTVDVKPDSIKKNAKAFGWNISRAGIPPLLRK